MDNSNKYINLNRKKKLTTGATSNNHPSTTLINSGLSESGALFRSVSMGAVEQVPSFRAHSKVQLHSPQIRDGTLPKSFSAPMPDNTFVQDTRLKTPSCEEEEEEEWVWKLTPQQLPPLPFYHPLERTAVTMSTDDIPLEEITRRISTFLKYHSIPANYDEDSARVSCMTEGLVKFVIQLWQRDSGVVLEVQRRQGCCIAMQAIRHHLLEAVQSGTLYAEKSRSTAVKPTRATCGIIQDLIEQSMVGEVPPAPPVTISSAKYESASALDLVKRLLDNERFDAQRLALESLCSLTNPTHVLLRDTDLVSRSILFEPEWQALMGRYFEKNQLDTAPHAGQPNNKMEVYRPEATIDNLMLDYEQGELIGELHFLALKVISQAIESLVAGKQVLDFSSNDPFWATVLRALYYNVTVAPYRPLEAVWSIRCLRHLQAAQPEVLQLIPSTRGLHQRLVNAHDFGRQHHRALEIESEQWMGRLGFAY